jgi:hypothetical protein
VRVLIFDISLPNSTVTNGTDVISDGTYATDDATECRGGLD